MPPLPSSRERRSRSTSFIPRRSKPFLASTRHCLSLAHSPRRWHRRRHSLTKRAIWPSMRLLYVRGPFCWSW
jgi:hypothetical protein